MPRGRPGLRSALILAFLVSAGLIFGRSPAVTVRPAAAGQQPPAERILPYADPWEGLLNLVPPPPGEAVTAAALARLAAGLLAMIEGRLGEAERQFAPLTASPEDRRVQAAAADLLGETLWSQGRWVNFIAGGAHYSQDLRDDLPLAEVFQGAAPEEWYFPPAAVELKLARSPLGTPVLPVAINGRKFDFWLDTGAGLTVLADDTARKAGVAVDGRATPARTATRLTVTARGTIIEELRLGPITARNLPSVVVSRKDLVLPASSRGRPVQIAGLIGWQALRRLRIGLDLKHGRCWLGRPAQVATDGRKSARNLCWIGYPFLRVLTADGVPMHFGLDSGAAHSSLTENGLLKSGVVPGKNRRVKIASAGGTESSVVQTAQRLDLWLAGRQVRLERLPVWPARGAAFMKLDGILGADLLGQAPLVIDGASGRFEWRP